MWRNEVIISKFGCVHRYVFQTMFVEDRHLTYVVGTPRLLGGFWFYRQPGPHQMVAGNGVSFNGKKFWVKINVSVLLQVAINASALTLDCVQCINVSWLK